MNVPKKKLSNFSRRWKMSELALFGSAIRDDFRPDSDVDVLVTFEPDTRWTLFDWAHMKEELEQIFGREIDLVSKRAIELGRNRRRREAILSSYKVVYGA